MYAVIEDSGTQLRVSEGDEITIDIRDLDEKAKSLTFDRVLMVGGDGEPKLGAPYLDGAKVEADILDREVKGEKIDVMKFKRRKGYRRKTGHRQRYMTAKVTKISG